MKIRSPSMTELHAFATAARHRSFTRAAQELCVTQAAVSRSISRLEAHFGQPLMQRSAHHLVLTEAGRQLLAAVAEPLAAIEAASHRLFERSGQKRLVLSAVPTLASVWLLPLLPDFHAQHPDIEVVFAPYRRDEDFTGAEPDAAILSRCEGDWPASWECEYLIGREMVPVAHPRRLRLRREAGLWRQPSELINEPLLYHTSTPARWQAWLAQATGEAVTPRLASGFDHVSILVQAVRTDMGIAVVQRCLVQEELASGQLVIPFDLPISLSKGYFLCAPAQRCEHGGLVVFRQWLRQTAARERALLKPAADDGVKQGACRAAF